MKASVPSGQVREMDSARVAQTSEEMERLRRENEELKEVLSAVQLDLEAKSEVSHSAPPPSLLSLTSSVAGRSC